VHRWWVFLHVIGVFGFLMAHGVSAYASLRLRSERDPARVSHLLELSASSVSWMWNSIGVLLLGGIVAGFTGHFWGQAWIWAAILVFVAVIGAMYALATGWARRLRTISAAMAEGTSAVSREQFEGILESRRPYTVAAVGFVGLLVLLYLMLFKPSLGFGGEAEAVSCPEPPAGAVGVCAVSDTAFVTRTVTAPGGQPFDLAFANEDAGTPHNVAIYTDDSATEPLFVGDIVDGPKTVTYHVPTLDPGSYFFRCDVHPVMTGTLEVQ
jgi:plastocyanin